MGNMSANIKSLYWAMLKQKHKVIETMNLDRNIVIVMVSKNYTKSTYTHRVYLREN